MDLTCTPQRFWVRCFPICFRVHSNRFWTTRGWKGCKVVDNKAVFQLH